MDELKSLAIKSKSKASPQSRFNHQLIRATRHLSEVSPELRKWIGTCGACELQIAWEQSLYEALVRAIAHQQLHGRAAATILGRLQAGFRGNTFPTPRQLARASTEKLRGMGFSAAKVTAIQGVAMAAERGDIPTRAEAASWPDDELAVRLMQLKGVGPWTVDMLLIFTLGRLDVMPTGDFGVQSGLKHLLNLPKLPGKSEFTEHTSSWRPYRSIAAWYLWRKADAEKSTAPVPPPLPAITR